MTDTDRLAVPDREELWDLLREWEAEFRGAELLAIEARILAYIDRETGAALERGRSEGWAACEDSYKTLMPELTDRACTEARDAALEDAVRPIESALCRIIGAGVPSVPSLLRSVIDEIRALKSGAKEG